MILKLKPPYTHIIYHDRYHNSPAQKNPIVNGRVLVSQGAHRWLNLRGMNKSILEKVVKSNFIGNGSVTVRAV